MKQIPLTQGQFAIVDDWWYEYLMQWKWFARWNPDTQSFYAMRNEGKRPQRKSILMSREIMKTPKGMICDHIHHNTLDNRECELRNVTSSQNNMNVRTRKNTSLGIKGISKPKDCKGFRVILDADGERVLDKVYPTLEEAIKHRRIYEKIYFGEFALQEKL